VLLIRTLAAWVSIGSWTRIRSSRTSARPLAVSVCALAVILMGGPELQAGMIRDISITSATTASGRAEVLANGGGPGREVLKLGVLLPEGDPFSSASIAAEFTVAKSGQYLFFADFPLNDVGRIVNQIGDNVPVPWQFTVALTRLTPDPDLLQFSNENDPAARIFLDVNEEGFIDTSGSLSVGRYLLAIQASQVGGRVEAGIGATLFTTPVPEPTSSALLLAGGAIVGWYARRRRRDSPQV
jgi:hypothetical protein